jgi:hypothetical protein
VVGVADGTWSGTYARIIQGCGGHLISPAREAEAAEQAIAAQVDADDIEPSVSEREPDVVDDLDLLVLGVEHFLVEYVVPEKDLALLRLPDVRLRGSDTDLHPARGEQGDALPGDQDRGLPEGAVDQEMRRLRDLLPLDDDDVAKLADLLAAPEHPRSDQLGQEGLQAPVLRRRRGAHGLVRSIIWQNSAIPSPSPDDRDELVEQDRDQEQEIAPEDQQAHLDHRRRLDVRRSVPPVDVTHLVDHAEGDIL